MPRNSSGTYTLPSGNPVVSGTLIEASWANTTLSDLASAMTNSLSRNGEGGMTAALRLFDGTVSLPGLAFTNETSTGLYRAGSGDMRLAVTGSQVMQFLTTGVAVTGTLSATGAVSLTGQTVTMENSTAYYPQLINRNKTADANGSYIALEKIRNTSIVQNGDVLGNLIFRGYDGTQYLQGAYINAIISATPGTNDMPADLAFGTTADGGAGPTERMRITQAGNLGIGTASPSQRLHVVSSGTTPLNLVGSTACQINLNDGTQSANWGLGVGGVGITGIASPSTYPLVFYTNGSERMRLDASGNLGVGTTSPAVKLDVYGSIKTANSITIGSQGNYAAGSIYSDSNWGMLFRAKQASPTFAQFMWATSSDSELMRIDTSGNLLVGTTTQQGNAKICSVSSTNGAAFRTTSSAYSYEAIVASRSGNVGKAITIWYDLPNGNQAGFINIDSASSVSLNNTSDYRAKENIQPLVNCIDRVKNLNPVSFNFKSDGYATEGFIAHEFADVMPQAVHGEKDAVDENGNPVYQAIDQSKIIPLLTAAIQELTARIEALENK